MKTSISQSSTETRMGASTRRIVALIAVTTLMAVAGLGCNTAHGFGKDVEKSGEKIQKGTD